jgi:hypothetical protein
VAGCKELTKKKKNGRKKNTQNPNMWMLIRMAVFLGATLAFKVPFVSRKSLPRLTNAPNTHYLNPGPPHPSNLSVLGAVKAPADVDGVDPYDGFPSVFRPVAEFIDSNTGGWALSYADCTPEDETTLGGVAFLLTNVAYLVVGGVLWNMGEVTLGLLTEVAGIFSYIYHYNQVRERE